MLRMLGSQRVRDFAKTHLEQGELLINQSINQLINYFLKITQCCKTSRESLTFLFISMQNVITTQSCSISKETIDLTVTRGTLWSNNLFKSANIIILCRTKASLW